ncbi:MAG: hypothetical protein IJJ77_10100 [Paludibacteraceae bacterium]|nr:hypothetical protein [Paludibacteraceae bacterium]
MRNKGLITGLGTILISAAIYADTPYNLHVWLKNGELKTYDINQVDSVTFVDSHQTTYKPLNEWTFLPAAPEAIRLSLTDEQKGYVRSGNEFAKKSFYLICKDSTLKKQEGYENLFYSPISLQIALGLCANGASTQGITEIANAFGIEGTNSLELMNDYFNKVILSLNSSVDSVTLKVNNSYWPMVGATVKEPFLTTAREKYYATVRHLDYVHNPEAAKDTIKLWAALATNNCIRNLDPPIDELTTACIGNAVYFKGLWAAPFVDYETRKDTFYQASGTPRRVDMMKSDEDLSFMMYAQTDDYQMVELNYGSWVDDGMGNMRTEYGGGTYSMVIVLPAMGKDLDETFNNINWDSIGMNMEMTAVDLRLPKFDFKNKLGLNEYLKALGIQDIFRGLPNALDISEKVSAVTQNSYIKVDENGTEAAAVTLIVDRAMGMHDPIKYTEMKVNRPFGFVIRERESGMILFMGKVTKI